ncbi:MAG: nucleotidyltransferase family protein [Clostridia bacterium]|nr:nucleotidyltransferase family protein [Clostridia bacterium]
MSKIVGVICEYNPFHMGHKYQIDKIREEMPNAKIVAIMSGNTVQRGEFAIIDKHKRAEIALECGVDLVLEMPFPYSVAAAEIFAHAGVEIASKCGCDYLYFGTENCDIHYLEMVASATNSREFENALKKHLSNKRQSYIVAKEKALVDMGFEKCLLANDMLGVEYIRAIRKKKAKIVPCAISRIGAGYNDTNECEIMSATAIREKYYKENVFASVPNEALSLYKKAVKTKAVLEREKAYDFLHRMALIIPREKFDNAFDSSKEIGALIKDSASTSKNGEDFFKKITSKSFTFARVRRVLIYAIYNIISIDKSPQFAFLLASNSNGREIINNVNKGKFNIITKHSDSRNLSPEASTQVELSYEVDKLYNTLLKSPAPMENVYKEIPIIK